MKPVKGVKFAYQPTPQTRELLTAFKDMVNDAIRIFLEEKVRGRLRLRDRVYKEFKERCGLVSCFAYPVAEVAWSIVRKHKRWHRRPYAKRLMFKMDAANFSLNYSIISLPFKKGERVLIPLKYGEYQRPFLMDKTLKRGSVTMTESLIVVAFSKEAPMETSSRRVGYDLNEKSVVGSDGTYHDLSEVARLHTLYGIRRSKFYEKHSKDRRLEKKFSGSRREKERVRQALHRVATLIVEKARANKEAIVIERLKGIRYAHQRGNGEAAKDRPMAIPSAAILRRLQGKVGGSTFGIRLSRIHVENVSCLRVHQQEAEGHRQELAMP